MDGLTGALLCSYRKRERQSKIIGIRRDKKSAKSHRLTLGRAADMGKEGEPDPSVVLKGEEVVLWWPTVRKFAVGSDEHPSRISVTVS